MLFLVLIVFVFRKFIQKKAINKIGMYFLYILKGKKLTKSFENNRKQRNFRQNAQYYRVKNVKNDGKEGSGHG